jgi:non-heme chloroperoxidase
MTDLVVDDGVRIEYVESGPADGRPVLLLAGFTAAASTWLYQVPALVRAGCRVIAVDLRGHGTADHPEGQTMARRAADVDALLTALDLRDAVLVGQSLGGNTVWAYLDAFGEDRVAGAVIVDQTPRMLNGPDWPHGFYGYDDTNADTFFATHVPRDTGHGTPIWRRGMRLVRLLRAARTAPKRASPDLTTAELGLLADHAHADWRPVIERTGIPVLFVAAAESELWPAEHAAAAAALGASATSAVIPNDGHPANIEQPAAFNRLLLGFLRRLG